jgi:hypothetical protein
MTSGWISFNEKTFKRLIYDNKTVTSCSNVGCKVDDFSISEKRRTSKIIAVKMEAMVRAMVMARARKMTAKTTMKDTAKTKKSR